MVSAGGEPDDSDMFESIGSIVSSMSSQFQCQHFSTVQNQRQTVEKEDKETHASEPS